MPPLAVAACVPAALPCRFLSLGGGSEQCARGGSGRAHLSIYPSSYGICLVSDEAADAFICPSRSTAFFLCRLRGLLVVCPSCGAFCAARRDGVNSSSHIFGARMPPGERPGSIDTVRAASVFPVSSACACQPSSFLACCQSNQAHTSPPPQTWTQSDCGAWS